MTLAALEFPDFFRSPEEAEMLADRGLVYWCAGCVCWHLIVPIDVVRREIEWWRDKLDGLNP